MVIGVAHVLFIPLRFILFLSDIRLEHIINAVYSVATLAA